MRDSHHGEHRPGLHRTGEGEPTKEDFDALVARVKALEDAGGGGFKYLFQAVGGSNGGGLCSFPAARVGDRVVDVVSVILSNTPPLQDNTGSIFEDVITTDGAINQVNTSDQSAVGFFVVLERG